MDDFLVKTATKQNLSSILTWLRREHAWTSHVFDGSFWHNRTLIADAQSKRELYVLLVENRVAGFLVGSLNGDLSIMEIRPELRGYGLGRQLVKHYLECIQKSGGLGACVECHPRSSIPFWKRLGFRPYFDRRPMPIDEDGPLRQTDLHLARILPVDREIPAGVSQVPVEIAFVDPANHVPIAPSFTTQAARVGMEWRLVTPFCEYFSSGDSYLRLTVCGKQVWLDKVKRINEIGGERFAGMTRLCCVAVPEPL